MANLSTKLYQPLKNALSREGVAFDTDRYLFFQVKAIKKFLQQSKDTLYLEFGGKIINDKHSARVLPGYRENTKFELIRKICSNSEVIFVVSAKDIVRGRIRGDYNLTYDLESIRKLDRLKRMGLPVYRLALTMVTKASVKSKPIVNFTKKLERRGIEAYFMPWIKDYPKCKSIVSQLSKAPFIPVRKKLVLILSPGGGSGKFGVCLSQLYHQMARGQTPRYLKFETFPVYDLPVNHPLNLAYMAASADFHDIVIEDLRQGSATSYKRDMENYEMLRILARSFGKRGKHLKKITSATNMGINMLSRGIVNDELAQKEAAAEIARRLVRYRHEVARGAEKKETLKQVRKIIRML